MVFSLQAPCQVEPQQLHHWETYPDTLTYTFNSKAAYDTYWTKLNRTPGFLMTEGMLVKRVPWYQYSWEYIKGWFGFVNHCDPTRVQIALQKTLYFGYLNQLNENTQLSQDMVALLPDTYLQHSQAPRSNETSALLQDLLVASYDQIATPSRSFGQSYGNIREHIDYLASIDLQIAPDMPLETLTIEQYSSLLTATSPGTTLHRWVMCRVLEQLDTPETLHLLVDHIHAFCDAATQSKDIDVAMQLLDRFHSVNAGAVYFLLEKNTPLSANLIPNSPLAIGYAMHLLSTLPKLTEWFFFDTAMNKAYQEVARLNPALTIESDIIAEVYFRALLDEKNLTKAWRFYKKRCKEQPTGVWNETDLTVLARELELIKHQITDMNTAEHVHSIAEIEQYKQLITIIPASTMLHRWAVCCIIDNIQVVNEPYSFVERITTNYPKILYARAQSLARVYGDKGDLKAVCLLSTYLTTDHEQFKVLNRYVLNATESKVRPLLEANHTLLNEWLISVYKKASVDGCANTVERKFILEYKPTLITNYALNTFIRIAMELKKHKVAMALLSRLHHVDPDLAYQLLVKNSILCSNLEPDSPLAIAFSTKLLSENQKPGFFTFFKGWGSNNYQDIARLNTALRMESDLVAQAHFKTLLDTSVTIAAWTFYKKRINKYPKSVWNAVDLKTLATQLELMSDQIVMDVDQLEYDEKNDNFRRAILMMIDAKTFDDTEPKRYKLNVACRLLIELILRPEDEHHISSNEDLEDMENFFALIKANPCQTIDPQLKEVEARYLAHLEEKQSYSFA